MPSTMRRRILPYLLCTIGLTMLLVSAIRPNPAVPMQTSSTPIIDIDASELQARNATALKSFDLVTAVNGGLCLFFGVLGLVRPDREAASRQGPTLAETATDPLVPSRPLWPALLLIAILALAIRIPGLGHGLWYDELYTVHSYLGHGWGSIATDFSAPNNHIFYTLLLETWDRLLPEQMDRDTKVLAWRLLSVMLGIVAVVCVAWFARGILGRRASVIAAAWFAIWPLAVDLSQQLRGYVLVMALGAAASAMLPELLRGGKRRWTVYVSLIVAMLWTHPLSLFVPIGHAAAACLSRDATPRSRRRFALSALAVAMITAQLYAFLIPDALSSLREQAGPDAPQLAAIPFLAEACRAVGTRTGWAAVSLPIVLLMMLGGVRLTRQSRATACIALLPPLLLITCALIWPPLRKVRFLALVAPQMCILLAAGAAAAMKLAGRPRRLPAGGAIGLAAIAIAALGLQAVYAYPVQAIREAVGRASLESGAAVCVAGLAARETLFYDDSLIDATTAEKALSLLRTDDIDTVIVPYPRVWLSRTAQDELRRLLESRFRLHRTHRGRLPEDPQVHVYRRKARGGSADPAFLRELRKGSVGLKRIH